MDDPKIHTQPVVPLTQPKHVTDMTPLTLEALTDEELVAACLNSAGRDDRPFKELFRRYQTTVWRICYGVVRNPQDAEDLTQDVFVKVYRNLDRFEGRSALKTWIYRIAINTSQNELRRRSRRPQVEGTSVEDMSEYLPGRETIDEYWATKVRNARLRAALQTLKPKQLEILRLKDFEQWQYAEIAEHLNISLSAAKMRVQRARLAVQEAYNALETAGIPT